MSDRNTNAKQRALLKELCYIRVDGIPIPEKQGARIGANLLAAHLGTGAFVSAADVLISKGGEIWIRASGMGEIPRWQELIDLLEICHKGADDSGYKYLIDAYFDTIRIDDILRRLVNPGIVIQR